MRYDRKVTVREMVEVEDEGGGSTSTPQDVATWWAHIEALGGVEQMQALQAGLRAPHRFTGPYRQGMTGATELYYDGRRFDITSIVDTEERHRELVILADEVRA